MVVHSEVGFTASLKIILQVFSKLRQEPDSMAWEPPPQNRRNPFLEPFWLQLLALTADGELGQAARVPLISAARRIASLADITESLIVLFADSKTLLAAAGVFSELAWQIRDRAFLRFVADQLEKIRVSLRCLPGLNLTVIHLGPLCSQLQQSRLNIALARAFVYLQSC